MSGAYNFHRQRGMTLIEMMIAGLISMILMVGVIKLFIGTKSTYLVTENASRAQENGRFALDLLTRYVRIAGFAEAGVTSEVPLPFGPECAADTCSRNGTELNNSDRLAVRFQVEPAPDNVDCNGNTIASSETIMQNVFWVQNDDNGTPSLYCRGYNVDTATWLGTAQAYVAGIDSMQIEYGIANTDDNVTRYVNADSIDFDDDTVRIRAVRVSLLAQSGQTDNANFGEKSYVLMDSAPLTYSDGQPRYIFSTTMYVENSGTN